MGGGVKKHEMRKGGGVEINIYITLKAQTDYQN
jgi:hypothetical protein